MNRVRQWFQSIQEQGPASPLIVLGLLLLLFFSASRLALLAFHWGRVSQVASLPALLFAGLRVDLLTIFWALAPLAFFLFLLPKEKVEKLSFIPIIYTTILLGVVVFAEAASIPFSNEFDCRPNRIFIEYMAHLREVVTTIFISFRAGGVVAIISIVFGNLGAFLLGRILFRSVAPQREGSTRALLVGYLIITIALSHDVLFLWPATIAMGSVSNSRLANNVALNSVASVACALLLMSGDELECQHIFGAMDKDEVFSRLKKYSALPKESFISEKQPLLHHQKALQTKPKNLVIIVEESMGAQFVGKLGGIGLTPRLDRLADEGLWLSNCYANGDRTVRGLEAVVAGFTQTPGRGITKLGPAPDKMFTLPRLLEQYGYLTEFIYAGNKHFDDMWDFFSTAGFQHVIDENDFPKEAFRGPWGVSDSFLLERAHETFVKHKEKPFFSLVLTTSVHDPFFYPDGKIEVKGPTNTLNNAVRYADYALGHFFDLARQADYYKDTVFLVFADHNIRTKGPGLLPYHIFHVPALFLGANVPQKEFSQLCNQIDLLPTALHLMGLSCKHPAYGRNLLTLPSNTKGRVLIASGYYAAFRVENDIVFFRPAQEPLQFLFTAKGKMKSVKKISPELVKDGLAHLLAPALLYYHGYYELAPK